MAKLNAAETAFFDSRGETVDASLVPDPAATPATTPAQPDPDATPATTPAQPDPAAAPAATPAQPSKVQPHQVPVAALQAERQKRQQVEQEAQQLRAQIEAFQRAAAPPKPAEPAAPSFEEDPVGALAYQNQALSRQLEEVTTWRQQQEQTAQQQQIVQSLVQQTAQSAREFRAQQPDYDQAFQFLTQQRDKQLAALIPDPAQREQAMFMEALQLSVQALQSGVSPAQRYYEIAQQWGYAPTAAPPASQVQDEPPESPAVKAIRKGMRQQSSVSSGGSTPPGELTAEQLLGIRDPAAFNKAWSQQFQRR